MSGLSSTIIEMQRLVGASRQVESAVVSKGYKMMYKWGAGAFAAPTREELGG